MYCSFESICLTLVNFMRICYLRVKLYNFIVNVNLRPLHLIYLLIRMGHHCYHAIDAYHVVVVTSFQGTSNRPYLMFQKIQIEPFIFQENETEDYAKQKYGHLLI